MTEAFNHLNKVKGRESQLAQIPCGGGGEQRRRHRGTLSSSWGGLGAGESAWVCPPAALGTAESKLRTSLREQASSIGHRP